MIQLVQEYIFSAKIYLKLKLVLLAQQKYNFNIKFLNLRLFSKVEEKIFIEPFINTPWTWLYQHNSSQEVTLNVCSGNVLKI